MRRCAAAVAVGATLGLALAGCGAGAGPSTANVTVAVTRDFGSRQVAQIASERVPGSETVIELLERHLRVGSRYGNDFVESIDGFSGTVSQRDWFYYVNGVQSPGGAGTTAAGSGERIWWDLHDWSATDSIPAVVGSYPAPFTDGGVRRPIKLSCAPDVQAACTVLARTLARVGVSVVRRVLRGNDGASADAIPGDPAIVVGTGSDLAGVPAARLVAAGPKASGVYVRFGPGAKTLEPLDPRGNVVRTLGAGTGLVAATVAGGASTPTWEIAGTDRAGVEAAARSVSPSGLRNLFALVISGAHRLPVPLDPTS